MLDTLWRGAGRVFSIALAATIGLATIVPPGQALAAGGEQITGKVASATTTYWSDAQVSAVAFVNDPAAGGWVAAADSDVAADGTYAIDLPNSGTYRVGFFDAGLVYADGFYATGSKVESGTDIPVAAGAAVAGIDSTLTALPDNIIEGKVNFVGETAPTDGIGVTVYSWDAALGAGSLLTKRTDADGSYRIHLPAKDVPSGFTGTYRVGFSDFDDVFASTYYQDSATVEGGKTIDLTTPAIASGIDATMSAQPSAWITAKDTYGLATAISRGVESGSGGTVVLASANAWQDVLVAGPLAHANTAPLLVTGKTIPGRVVTEINRIAPREVIIVGGTGAVSLEQEIQLRALGVPVVRRLAGRDAAGTAVQVADELTNTGLAGAGVCVAPLETPAPSLAAAALAVGTDQPILFTYRKTVPAATLSFIGRHAPASSVIFGGGTNVLSAAYKKFPNRVQLSDSTFAGVSAKGSAYGISQLELGGRIVGLVSSAKPVDAFVADTYFGSKRITAVATSAKSLDSAAKSYLTTNKASLARVIAIGSTGAISTSTYNTAVNAVK